MMTMTMTMMWKCQIKKNCDEQSCFGDMRHLLTILYKYGEIVEKSKFVIFLSCFFLQNSVMEHTVRVHSTHLGPI